MSFDATAALKRIAGAASAARRHCFAGDVTPVALPSSRMAVDVRGASLGILASLGAIAALSWAQGFVILLLPGIVLAYTLYPLVAWLVMARIPRIAAAMIVMLSILGALAFGAYALRGQMQAIIEGLPEAAALLALGASEYGSDDLVTRAGGSPEARHVQNPQFTARVVDQMASLQGARRPRDADAPQAQHMGEELLRQGKLLRADAIAGHEQPAGQARFRLVKAITGCGLRNLCHQCVGVTVQRLLQGRISVELDAKRPGGHAQRVAGSLHQRAYPGDPYAQDEGHPGHAFVADHAHLQRAALVDGGQQRYKAVDREIDVADGLARLVQHLAKPEMHKNKLVTQAPIFPWRNALQDPIGPGRTNVHKHGPVAAQDWRDWGALGSIVVEHPAAVCAAAHLAGLRAVCKAAGDRTLS